MSTPEGDGAGALGADGAQQDGQPRAAGVGRGCMRRYGHALRKSDKKRNTMQTPTHETYANRSRSCGWGREVSVRNIMLHCES